MRKYIVWTIRGINRSTVNVAQVPHPSEVILLAVYSKWFNFCQIKFFVKLKVNSSSEQVLVSPDNRLFGQVREFMQFTGLNTRDAKVLAWNKKYTINSMLQQK